MALMRRPQTTSRVTVARAVATGGSGDPGATGPAIISRPPSSSSPSSVTPVIYSTDGGGAPSTQPTTPSSSSTPITTGLPPFTAALAGAGYKQPVRQGEGLFPSGVRIGGAQPTSGGSMAYGPTSLTGVTIGGGSIGVTGTILGVPVSIGGGGEPSQGSPSTPGGSLVAPPPSSGGSGECLGAFSVKIGGQCVDLSALPPGGDPALTGLVQTGGYGDGYGAAVKGIYGVGLIPRVEVQTVRRCPAGMALGKDGVCYQGLHRNSPKRAWPMGMKPLLTPGERRAIRIAESAARKLHGAKKSIKAAGKALEKVC